MTEGLRPLRFKTPPRYGTKTKTRGYFRLAPAELGSSASQADQRPEVGMSKVILALGAGSGRIMDKPKTINRAMPSVRHTKSLYTQFSRIFTAPNPDSCRIPQGSPKSGQ
jgi:hypothetical protein